MRSLFECETEIGRCDYELNDAHPFRYAEQDYATVYAHTEATMSGKGLVKIEHNCYLRHGGDEPDQPWISPEVRLESMLASKEEMIAFVRALHENFTGRIRKEFPQQYLV
jgi:hypothetical protein